MTIYPKSMALFAFYYAKNGIMNIEDFGGNYYGNDTTLCKK